MNKKILLAGMVMFALTSIAQPSVTRNVAGTVNGYRPDKGTLSIKNANDFFKNILQKDTGDHFILKKVTKDKSLLKHEVYEQVYKGIPVVGCGYVLHLKNNELIYAHGNYIPVKDLSIIPTLSSEDAVIKLKEKGQLEYADERNNTANLLIFPPVMSDGEIKSNPKLVYEVSLHSIGKIGYVDAHDGEIINIGETMSKISATGTLQTSYSGNRLAKTQFYLGGYHLADSTREVIIHTWNANQSSSPSDRLDLTDYDNNWTKTEHSGSSLYQAFDVHWGFQSLYDYLYSHHGRIGADDNGHEINAYVNYPGNDLSAWDPDNECFCFSRNYYYSNPTTSIDVIAHEFGHAVSFYNNGWTQAFLNSRSTVKRAETNAMGEGLSDIWGVIVESGIKGTTGRWKIAEECYADFYSYQNYNCMRNIETPADPHAYYPLASTYNDAGYNYSSDPHIKGGVFSRWFYLLANGGSGTNGLGNSYNVNGIGFPVAENLIVDAIYDGYLYQDSCFVDVREKIKQYAIDHCNPAIVLEIERAWYAVGVGSNPDIPTISGPDVLCSSTVYEVEHLPLGASVSWSIVGSTPASLTLYQHTPSLNKCTITRNGFAQFTSITIKATITVGGSVVSTPTKTVYRDNFSGTYEETSGYYNGYNYPAISQQPIDYPNPTNVYIGGVVTVRSNYFTGKNITTSGPYQNYHFIGGNTIEFALSPWNVSQPFTIIVQEQGCDDEVRLTFNAVTYPSYAFQLNITPQGDNSFELRLCGADGVEDEETAVLNLEGRQGQDADAQKNLSWHLEVTNATTGRKAASISLKEPTYLLDATGWETGIYVVRALVGEESLTGKITVK